MQRAHLPIAPRVDVEAQNALTPPHLSQRRTLGRTGHPVQARLITDIERPINVVDDILPAMPAVPGPLAQSLAHRSP